MTIENPPDNTITLEMDVFAPAQESTLPHPPLNKHFKDYAAGIVLLLIVVVLWTSSNFVTQDIFEGGYEKPFLVTYLNTSAFTLYLLPFFLRRGWKRWSSLDHDIDSTRNEYRPLVADPGAAEASTDFLPSKLQSPSENKLPPLSVRETIQLAFIFCFFWFTANWSVNASLNYTSVASATILSSMSGFFTLGIGWLFRVETLNPAKIGAVLTSFGGVLLVSLSDSSQSVKPLASETTDHLQPILGDSLALLSAIFYALYVILLKVRIQSEDRINMQLFFGFVGLFNVLTCWPLGIILHLTGIETFELPSTGKVIAGILVNMAITLSSDYLYVLSMLKTTPLLVTVGLSLTIPLAVIGDMFLSKPARGQVLLGAALVIISFVVVGVDNMNTVEKKDMPMEELADGPAVDE